MKQLNNDMKVWTLDECINESVGALGTPNREQFEAKVAQKVERTQRKSVHITIPVNIYDMAISRANSIGESMSMYITNLLSQDARCLV